MCASCDAAEAAVFQLLPMAAVVGSLEALPPVAQVLGRSYEPFGALLVAAALQPRMPARQKAAQRALALLLAIQVTQRAM
jgi:hypothetical protein